MPEPASLVLIHGHGVDASIWEGVYAGLAESRVVLKPDFAQLSSHTTIEGYAEDLHTRLEAAQVNKVVLVGHSMGGYIALAFAEKYPEKMRGLVLFHSTAFADDEAKKEQRLQVIKKLDAEGSRAFLETAITGMFAPENRTKMGTTIKQLIDRYSRLPKEALHAGIQAIRSRPDRTEVLRRATYPVMIVAGRQDQVVPFEKSQQLMDMAPTTQGIVLEQAGHLGMIEQPDQALEALKAFLSRL